MIYDYPEYYEIAFSFRDIPLETAFLDACIKRYCKTGARNLLEVACGPAPHAGELTKRGYRYSGLDINRNMLDHGTYKWRHLIPRPILLEADMVDFTSDETYDFAFVMLGSLYLDSTAQMSQHFDAMARALKPGGIYFLDWCLQFSDPLTAAKNNAYRVEKDGITIESEFRLKLLDEKEQMYEEVWSVTVNDHGRHQRFDMVERNRAIMPQEFLSFVEARDDFEFVDWFADWDFDKPITEGTDPNRPLALIRRK